MSGPRIMLEINGDVVPAADCTWYQVAPCGCTCGASVVLSSYGDDYRITEDAAWKALSGNKREVRKDQAAGFRIELGLTADVKDRLVVNCPHTPKWGVAL